MLTVEFFFLHFLLVYLQTVTVINLNFLAELFQIKIMASRASASELHRYPMRYRKAAILFIKKKKKFFFMLLGYINNPTKFHDNRIKTSL